MEERCDYKEQLKKLLPFGMITTRKWLLSQGFSRHALDNALKSSFILSLATGVYSLYTTEIQWEGVVASLQREGLGEEKTTGLGKIPSVHVGGLTALAISGYSQYIGANKKQLIHLYSYNKQPAWLKRIPQAFDIEWHGLKSLWPDSFIPGAKFIKTHQWRPDVTPVYYSCPEKAILEVLSDVPSKISFEHADELMQGLVSLSPGKLDELLSVCVSVKVKRLFFWFAKRQNYPWLSKLNQDKYDLGSGKRVLAHDGKLDTEYLITVPIYMANINDDSGE